MSDIRDKIRHYRALVVEDEVALQRLLISALKQQGFQCDSAVDGHEAEEQIARARYDAVVTDLCMPKKHGHALATQLMAMERRPVVVIHTGVIEPRLAKDLLAKGVDDIIFKPFDFGVLAAKVRALVERRMATAEFDDRGSIAAESDSATLQNYLSDDLPDGAPVPVSHLAAKLSTLARLLPVSTAAIDVYMLTTDNRTQAPQLAAAVQRDPALTAEVLRLANSSFYNCSNQPTLHIDRAIVRIGHKRIGELALGMSALSALTTKMVPWMDVRLAWKQSMAAGIAVEMLIDQGGHHAAEEGLLLSAIMHPLGRVALGTLYPRQYVKMIEQCQLDGDALQNQERVLFSLSHAKVLADLLGTWNVPRQVRDPLKLILEPYSTLARTPEPTRTKAELVKLAAFVGRMAVGRWEPWDVVEPPPIRSLQRLRISRIADVIERTKDDLKQLTVSHANQPTEDQPVEPPSRQLDCCDLSGLDYDVLGAMLPSMGIQAVIHLEHALGHVERTALVNCIGAPARRLAGLTQRSSRSLVVTDAERTDSYKEYGSTFILPASFARLRTACLEASSEIQRMARTS